MSEKKPISVKKLSDATGLGIENVKSILSHVDITFTNEEQQLSGEEQEKILAHIRNKRAQKTSSKATLKLSPSSKLSLKPKAEAPPTPAPQTIMSLDTQFKKSSNTSKKEAPKRVEKQETTYTVEEVLAQRLQTAQHTQPKAQQALSKPAKNKSAASGQIAIPSIISVTALAKLTSLKTSDIIKSFFDLGEMVTENQEISYAMAEIVLHEHGFTVSKKQETQSSRSKNTRASSVQQEDLRPRSPIVTIMGHVDHGKTSLLDRIRSTNHAATEKGGITQHIGAWQVATKHGSITFIDTPGHESFSAMRSRGAKVTDIVILVVAADDGVMPQTKEAIQHTHNANVPMIVAVNKMDKEAADIERIRNELSQHNVLSEEWGGNVQFLPVSAKTGDGVTELLESISLQAEIMELKANYAGHGRGYVVESRLDKGKGPVATVIVQSGHFKRGDSVFAQQHYGKIRNMIDSNGKSLKEAGPSQCFELIGLSGTSKPGDIIEATTNDKEARILAEEAMEHQRQEDMRRKQALKTEYFLKKISEGNSDTPEIVLPIILKADTDGSLEALADFIQQDNAKEKETRFTIQIVGQGVGGINSSDVQLALASSSIIIGFNVRADLGAKQLIQAGGVKIQYFGIIYELIDYLHSLETEMIEPDTREEIIGEAQVKDVFRASKFGTIAGCVVKEGSIKKNSLARVLRDDTVIFDGKIESLRRFQDNADEVRSGLECGIGIKAYSDIKVGDVIETYVVHEKEKKA